MIETFVLIMMLCAAIFIVASGNLKQDIIALGVLSLLSAFCYLLFHAPDVAVAEAVIGSALATILYIVAFKKHHTFYVYFTSVSGKVNSDAFLRSEMDDVFAKITKYCFKHELEAQCVFTWDSPETIAKEHVYDIILQHSEDEITVFGVTTEQHVQKIYDILKTQKTKKHIVFKALQSEEGEQT